TGDLVGVMLALDDLANVLCRVRRAGDHARGRLGGGEHGRRMGFEQLEEVAGLRQQALEPGEHRTQSPCLLARDPAEPAPVDRRLKLAGAERADQVPEVFLVDGLRGLVQRKPATLALPLFLPGVEFVGDREWKDVDVDHQRSAAALALAIAIASERNRADSTEHSSFLPRLARG